jgi:hypothetical protein
LPREQDPREMQGNDVYGQASEAHSEAVKARLRRVSVGGEHTKKY